MEVAVRASARDVRVGVVPSLVRVEGRKLILHPVAIAGVALAVLLGALAPFFPTVWVFAGSIVVAAQLTTSRDVRHGTDEQYASLPAPAASLTTAHLLSITWAVGLGALIAAAEIAYSRGIGKGLLGGGEHPFQNMVFIARFGITIVALFGTTGVLLGKWLPSAAVGPVALIVLFVGAGQPWSPWYLWPDTPSAGWHQVAAWGLVLVTGGLALLRDARRPGPFLAVALGLIVLAVGETAFVITT